MIRWIEPATLGMATKIEIFLTGESRAVIDEAFAERNERRLLAFGVLRNGTNLVAASSHIECEPVDLKSPGDPRVLGIVFGDLVFPQHDELGTGRPVRMWVILPVEGGGPPTVLELGGYEVGERRM